MQPLLRVVLPVVVLGLLIAACGQPRPAADQGPVCQSMGKLGHLPAPWPSLTPDVVNEMHRQALVAAAPQVLADVKAANFRAKVAVQAAGRRQAAGMMRRPPGLSAAEGTQILSVSAGGAWGAFSIGFLDGWGRNLGTERRPKFDIVTGVSTGSMIAPAIFLGDEALIAKLRSFYANLRDSDVYTPRPFYTLLGSPSLFDTAPLRAKVNALVTTEMVEKLAVENVTRTLAVMATNLDSGVPEVFDLTAIAADTRLTLEQRRLRIVAAVMASSAEPIAFPPEPIDGNLYVDGGLRLHVFFTQELMAALDDHAVDVSVVVSGDMAVPRECTGLGLLSIVGRTASIAIDQLLRASVQGLLAVGTKPGNKARMINAAPLIYYGNELPAGTPRPPCALSEAMFDPVFGDCLVRNGTEMGLAQPVPWKLQLEGGQQLRISALR